MSGANAIPDVAIRDAVNDVIDRLTRIDDEVGQAFSFRAMMEGLDPHYDPPITGDHADAIMIVRAGILRSLIGCLTAIYDRHDRRGNRASFGQVVHALRTEPLAGAMTRSPSPFIAQPAELASACRRYDELAADPRLESVRSLRDQSIAHSLIGMERGEEVPYDDLYALQEEAGALLHTFFTGIGIARPSRLEEIREICRARAHLFWSTYLTGMRSSQS